MRSEGKITHLFLDLDDTVWSSKMGPDTAAMWGRKDHALNNVFGVTEGVEKWMRQVGDTDAGVLMSAYRSISAERRLQKGLSPLEAIPILLREMADYYLEYSPASITRLLFDETIFVLDEFSKKYRLGIVSGNDDSGTSGKDGVGTHKLKQAGLSKYFPDQSMQFWGGDMATPRRANLLNSAHNKVLMDNDGKNAPLVYIADSKPDMNAVLEFVHIIEKPIDVRFGWLYRRPGQLVAWVNHLVEALKLPVEYDVQYFQSHNGYRDGSIYRVKVAKDKNLTIHLAPTLIPFLDPEGLLKM